MDPEFASTAVTEPQVPLFHHPGRWEQESYDRRRGILAVIHRHAPGKCKLPRKTGGGIENPHLVRSRLDFHHVIALLKKRARAGVADGLRNPLCRAPQRPFVAPVAKTRSDQRHCQRENSQDDHQLEQRHAGFLRPAVTPFISN